MVWLFWGVDSGDVRWSGCFGVWTVEMLGGLVVLGCGQWICGVDS